VPAAAAQQHLLFVLLPWRLREKLSALKKLLVKTFVAFNAPRCVC
jgi:hypothetical protein